MIIAYKQNFHFRIHCKNPKNNIIINTPPSSSIYSTTSPKVKTMEGKGVWVCSLARNTSRVKGRDGALGWE